MVFDDVFFSHAQLKHEMSNIMKGMIINYTGQNRTTEHSWDYVQKTVSRPFSPVWTRHAHKSDVDGSS